MSYPNCDLLTENSVKIHTIIEFLETLKEEKGVRLMEEIEGEHFSYHNGPLRDSLYEFFGIDLRELENERRAMLEEQRKMNER